MPYEHHIVRPPRVANHTIVNSHGSSRLSKPAVTSIQKVAEDKASSELSDEHLIASRSFIDPYVNRNAIPASPYIKPFQLKPNNTGLPDNLNVGVETLSGYSIDNVKVHNNSDASGTPVQRNIDDPEIDAELRKVDEGGVNIPDFIAWQRRIRAVKPTYRTMGPEFEFAKLAEKDLPVHADLAKSGEKINGLPFVIETDAGSVVELACPPFVIATSMDDWEQAKLRSMQLTDLIETALKEKAEAGAGADKDLGWILEQVAALFGTTLNYTELKDTYTATKLLPFSKGYDALVNEFFSKTEVTNAQINLKMTTNEIGAALRSAVTGTNPSVALKGLLTEKLTEELGNRKGDDADGKFDNRIAIIAYYLSQVPTMALQMIMNEARSHQRAKKRQTKDENRADFKESSRSNSQLLVSMSGIKDALGFWIKASLNDMMRTDPEIQQMVFQLNAADFADFVAKHSNNEWLKYKAGLEAYGDMRLDTSFETTIGSIFGNLHTLAGLPAVPPARKMDFPRYREDGATADLMDFEQGAPFMARPDTYVPLGDGHLVEVRGLNKKIYSNEYMRGFQMPHFRKYRRMADKDTPDYYAQASANRVKTLANWPAKIGRHITVTTLNTEADEKRAIEEIARKIHEAIATKPALNKYLKYFIQRVMFRYRQKTGIPPEAQARIRTELNTHFMV